MRKIHSIVPTAAMTMDVLAKSLEGKKYNLSAGDPNLPVCDALCRALHGADIAASHNYGSSQGDLTLRRKIWQNPEEVVIANGAKQLIYMALQVLTDPGDAVVLVGPCWSSYRKMCGMLHLTAVQVIGKPENAYQPVLEEVAAAITPQTAAVVINDPVNPTGKVYSRAYKEGLLQLVQQKDCYLISDEIYRHLIDERSGREFFSFRGDPSVITVDGFSKCLNITGWRAGYAIASEPVAKAIAAVQSQLSGPPGTLIQKVLSEAWENLELTGFDAYRERVDTLCRIEKFAKARPEAGFYFLVPIAEHWKDEMEVCETMMKMHRIAMTPGGEYGVPRTVRLSVAGISPEELQEILEYLKEV